MKRILFVSVLAALAAVGAFAQPLVDGKVGSGEYAHSQKVIDGSAVLSWADDGKGGLFVALAAKGKGWAGVGLGSKRMAGAYIYLGFVGADGKAVFSEQDGKGHRHTESAKKTADQSAVVLSGGTTTLEFHIPASQLPFTGKSVPFIVAFSDSADLVTFHGDNYDAGVLVY